MVKADPVSGLPLYIAIAERDGADWLLRVDDLPGVFSQVRRLEKAEEWIRDAIAVTLEVPPDSFEVAIRPRFDGELGDLVDETIRVRHRVEEIAQASATMTATAVHRLVAEGLTQRDIGVLLGLSFQRVAQLASQPRPQGSGRPDAIDERSRAILGEPLPDVPSPVHR